jgi:hypothetical protein
MALSPSLFPADPHPKQGPLSGRILSRAFKAATVARKGATSQAVDSKARTGAETTDA